MKQTLLVILSLLCTGACVGLYILQKPPALESRDRMTILKTTLIPIKNGKVLRLSSLSDVEGRPFLSKHLYGKWSILFFGFTSCPSVCPTTLQTLSSVANMPESGVSSGEVQILFVTIDPQNDTPAQMKNYIKRWRPHIQGLTGPKEALQRVMSVVGAAYRAVGETLDHSTSLFILNPKGRTAGLLLRPSNPKQIIRDLKRIRSNALHSTRLRHAR